MHSVPEAQRFTWLHHAEIRLKLKCRTYPILLSPSICSLHKGQNPTSTRKEENSPVQKGNDERQEQALHRRPSRAADGCHLSSMSHGSARHCMNSQFYPVALEGQAWMGSGPIEFLQ